MEKEKWVLCPICNNKTRIKMRLLNIPAAGNRQSGKMETVIPAF